MEKASMSTRNEVITRNRKVYQKAKKKEKGVILDSVCQAVGLSRDRAARLLRQHEKPKNTKQRDKRGRKPQYHDQEIVQLLEKMWMLMDCVCGKRLAADVPRVQVLPVNRLALRRHTTTKTNDA